MEKKIKFDPRAQYHAMKLQPDGSFDYSKIPKLTSQPININTPEGRLRLLSGEHLTADQKLKIMLREQIERQNEQAETIFDSFDFEVPDEYSPVLHPIVTTEMLSQKEIKEAYYERKKLEREAARKKNAGEDPASIKPAKTGGPSGPGKTKEPKSARPKPPSEAADEEGDE